MKLRPELRRLAIFTISVISTLVVAGCAQTNIEQPQRQSGSASGAGELAEIVVTAQKTAIYLDSVVSSTATFAMANPDEEIWIIAQPAAGENASHVDDAPGTGAMLASVVHDSDGTVQQIDVPLPLEHTEVNATVNGYISTVDVKQRFSNPFSEKIEAVYMFPLPERSAVTEFVMTIGERKIRGILREKEEAFAIYEQARSQGYRASLLVQHRPNVFEQKVANIEPGKAIDIEIRYFHSLTYHDGWYSFVFPTVVGPRFNPAGTENPLAANPRGTQAPAAGSAIDYLRPSERSAHDISIRVTVGAGSTIDDLRSTHAITTSKTVESGTVVELAGGNTIPNRDFVLAFKVAGDKIRSNLLTYTQPGDNQGYFTLMLYPPEELESLPRQDMELVFVVDNSGSMSGTPIRQAKAAVAAALSQLGPDDTFQIIRFSDNVSRFGVAPVPANAANIRLARQFLRDMHGTGSTMMIEGIKAALDFPHDPARFRVVSFLTDGFIGNETEILAAIHSRIGESRIFSFGVGESVNRYLLERMAKEGRGAVAFLGLQDSGAEVMSLFIERVSRAAMTDLQIDWGNMSVSDLYPAKLPDLFVGRPVFVTGKFRGRADNIVVSGLTGNASQQFNLSESDDVTASSDLSKIWARRRIAELADRQTWQSDHRGELASAIRQTALEYQLMSEYTSFIAVDSTYQTQGAHGTTVRQAVPVPEGVRYETTVDGNQQQ